MNGRIQQTIYLVLFLLFFSGAFLLRQPASEAFSVAQTLTIQAGASSTIQIVDPDADALYTWELSPLSFGSVTSGGTSATYTAPAVGGAGTLTVTEWVSGSSTGSAAISIIVLRNLSLTASATTIIAEEQITISVSGTASSSLTWSADYGSISGSGSQVTYTGPDAAVDAVITVTDEVGNTGSIVIEVITQLTGEWDIYTNRKDVNHFYNDGTSLWVSTKGGLINATSQILYTKADGLPSNHVTATATDGSGGLWIACRWGGLVHMPYNSELELYNTENSDIPSDEITSLAYISGKGLYLGTFGGGVANLTFDDLDEPVWEYHKKETFALPTNNVTCLSHDSTQGILWVGTIGGGVARYYLTSENWETFGQSGYPALPSDDVTALAPDGSGGVWMGTNGYGMAHIQSDYSISVKNESNSSLQSNRILSLYRASTGNIFVGTMNSGFYLISNGQIAANYSSSNSPLPGNDISAISMNSSGTLNVGILEKGYGTFNLTLQTYVAKDTSLGANELPDNDVSAIARDMSGGSAVGLWIGTLSNGLIHADSNGNWVEYTKSSTGYNLNNITALLSDKNGGVWIGTENAGLIHLNASGSVSQLFNSSSGLPTNHITLIENDGSGGLWIGTIAGLVHMNSGNEFTVYSTSNSDLPFDYISSVTIGNSGRLWVGTYGGGLALMDGYEFTLILNATNSDLPNNFVYATALYGNAGIWIGLLGGDGGLVLRSFSNDWVSFTTENSILPHNWITAIESDSSGGVWVATYGGGLLLVDSSGDQANYNVINSGSAQNDILAIEPDGSGGLWIGYDGGGLAHLTLNRLLPDSGESPVATQSQYSSGDQCRVIIPSNPDGYDQYVGLQIKESITYTSSLYFLANTNIAYEFDGSSTYIPWAGGNVLLDFPVDSTTTRGDYVVYLLRVPSGVDPADLMDWQLGATSFSIN